MIVTDQMVKVAADAMEAAEFDYSLTLTSLVDGVHTYTLTYYDGSPPLEFDIIDDGYTHIAAKKRETQARAALTAALALQGWQDIATAPKDGRRVLLYCDKIDPPVFQAQWLTWKGGPWAGAGEWIDIWNNDPIETNDGPIQPTLWQPEPAPPATAGKEG